MKVRAPCSWWLLVGLVACGPDKEGDTGASGAEATGGASETGRETGGSGDRGDCERYVECVGVVTPGALP